MTFRRIDTWLMDITGVRDPEFEVIEGYGSGTACDTHTSTTGWKRTVCRINHDDDFLPVN